MDELFEVLGLDKDAPVAKAVEKVKTLKSDLEDKGNIIVGFQKQIENYEEQIDSIASGVAEARVKDLVQKVQNETGYHVGKDNMATLNKKAAQHLYADEEERENIYNDMKAHTIAYGTKIGISDKIKSLTGDRDESDGEDKKYVKAKRLIDSGQAENYDEAFDILMEQGTENED